MGKEERSHTLVCLTNIDINFHPLKFSNYNTILNIMSNILRFIYNCKNVDDKLVGPFSLHEYEQAELRIVFVEQHRLFCNIIQCIQSKKSIKDPVIGKFNPFLDENGMLRIKTGKCENKRC